MLCDVSRCGVLSRVLEGEFLRFLETPSDSISFIFLVMHTNKTQGCQILGPHEESLDGFPTKCLITHDCLSLLIQLLWLLVCSIVE